MSYVRFVLVCVFASNIFATAMHSWPIDSSGGYIYVVTVGVDSTVSVYVAAVTAT